MLFLARKEIEFYPSRSSHSLTQGNRSETRKRRGRYDGVRTRIVTCRGWREYPFENFEMRRKREKKRESETGNMTDEKERCCNEITDGKERERRCVEHYVRVIRCNFDANFTPAGETQFSLSLSF